MTTCYVRVRGLCSTDMNNQCQGFSDVFDDATSDAHVASTMAAKLGQGGMFIAYGETNSGKTHNLMTLLHHHVPIIIKKEGVVKISDIS